MKLYGLLFPVTITAVKCLQVLYSDLVKFFKTRVLYVLSYKKVQTFPFYIPRSVRVLKFIINLY